jgi:hypothetical protein
MMGLKFCKSVPPADVPPTVVQMVDDFLDRYVRFKDVPEHLTLQCKEFLQGGIAVNYAQSYVLQSVIAERELLPNLFKEGTEAALKLREVAYLRAVADPLLIGFARKAQPRAALGARSAAVLQELPFAPEEATRKQLGRIVRTTFDPKQHFPWSRKLRQEVVPDVPQKEGELVDMYETDWTVPEKMDGKDPRTWDVLEACRLELVGAREEGGIPRLAKAIHDAVAATRRIEMTFPTLEDEVVLAKEVLVRVVIEKEMAARSDKTLSQMQWS